MKPHHPPRRKSYKLHVLIFVGLVILGGLWWMYQNGRVDPSWPIADARAVESEVMPRRGRINIWGALYYVGRVKVSYEVDHVRYTQWLEITKGESRADVQRDVDAEILKGSVHKLRYDPRDPSVAVEVPED